ncbi:hypothetical protein HY988_03180 [Candidatus Micrarchaeota archaeon]|nr:hypothetical protein [Candidatus Micrarchaeota archaeon]
MANQTLAKATDMYEIPLLYLKDKQVFRDRGLLQMLGKPTDIMKKLAGDGYQLVHIVDLDAIAGSSTNLDTFDKLTYFINVQVEFGDRVEFIKKVLNLKCRVVLSPSTSIDLSKLTEKKLLVAKVDDSKSNVDQFHDVIIENADSKSIKHYNDQGKRVLIYEKDKEKVKGEIWGIILSDYRC